LTTLQLETLTVKLYVMTENLTFSFSSERRPDRTRADTGGIKRKGLKLSRGISKFWLNQNAF